MLGNSEDTVYQLGVQLLEKAVNGEFDALTQQVSEVEDRERIYLHEIFGHIVNELEAQEEELGE